MLNVTATRTANILGIRQFPLRVNSDLPCKVAVTVKLTPRSGKKRPSVALTLLAPVAAGGQDGHGPAAAERRRRADAAARAGLASAALVADVRVTATTDRQRTDGVVTQRVNR